MTNILNSLLIELQGQTGIESGRERWGDGSICSVFSISRERMYSGMAKNRYIAGVNNNLNDP